MSGAAGHSHFGVQEVRGEVPEVTHLAHGLARTQYVFWSMAPPTAGGAMSFHSKADFPKGAAAFFDVLVEGRAIVSYIAYENKITCFKIS